MKRPAQSLIVVCAVVLFCFVLGGMQEALPFAEEPIKFKDPRTGREWNQEISTIHFDLLYAMAIAAGFSDSHAAKMQIWDQLVDSERVGPDDRVVYTNCHGKSQEPPEAVDVCPNGFGDGKLIWPMWHNDAEKSCATSRYGSYAPFFHWPHNNWAELGQLRLWAYGEAKGLNGYGVYAWGDTTAVNIFDAKCLYVRPEVIDTGIRAGSLEAFATYLHVLADSYSHADCIALLDTAGYPWSNHTLNPANFRPCWYIPKTPNNEDAHGEEFGSGAGRHRTDGASIAVYNELVARSMAGEGRYVPLSIDTVLASMEGQPSLIEALRAFVHSWNFQNEAPNADRGEFAANRRAYAAKIAGAAKALRVPVSPFR